MSDLVNTSLLKRICSVRSDALCSVRSVLLLLLSSHARSAPFVMPFAPRIDLRETSTGNPTHTLFGVTCRCSMMFPLILG